MKFSIIWAAATPTYVGMIYGLFRMWPQTIGSQQAMMGLGIGLMFGGALALPFVASNIVASLLSSWLTRGQPFFTQFAAFAVLSFLFYYQMLRILDRTFRAIGGFDFSGKGLLLHAAFVATSLAVAFAFMALGIKPRTAWTG